MKKQNSSSAGLEFSSPKSAEIAGQVLLGQLKNIGESKINSKASGKKLEIEISDKRESRQKAGMGGAKRLGKMLVELDRQG